MHRPWSGASQDTQRVGKQRAVWSILQEPAGAASPANTQPGDLRCPSSHSEPIPAVTLPRDEVHVWTASLDRPAVELERLHATLSPDEVARAARFRFEQDRRRFVAARGLLRAILSRYLDRPPSELAFEYGPFGKPSLAPGTAQPLLHFNLSHAGGLALYVLACDRRVGVDLEQVRPLPDMAALVERFFAEREKAEFRALPPAGQQEAFFTCWTRKEAYIKARGDGLTFPLHAFDVTIRFSEPAILRSVSGDTAEAARWSLRSIRPGAGYVATVAVEGHGWRLTSRVWPG